MFVCTTLIQILKGGDCGIGWQQRNVTCQQEDGVIVSEELCQKGAYQSNINVTEEGRERLEVRLMTNVILLDYSRVPTDFFNS